MGSAALPRLIENTLPHLQLVGPSRRVNTLILHPSFERLEIVFADKFLHFIPCDAESDPSILRLACLLRNTADCTSAAPCKKLGGPDFRRDHAQT